MHFAELSRKVWLLKVLLELILRLHFGLNLCYLVTSIILLSKLDMSRLFCLISNSWFWTWAYSFSQLFLSCCSFSSVFFIFILAISNYVSVFSYYESFFIKSLFLLFCFSDFSLCFYEAYYCYLNKYSSSSILLCISLFSS